MIRLIKSNTPINYLIMFVIMLFLWAFKFYYMPTPIETYDIHNYIIPSCPETLFWNYLSAGISFALFYLFGMLVIRANSELQIVEFSYQSSGVMFVILSGAFINAQRVLPELISAMFFFLAIVQAFKSYNKVKANKNCFDAGFLSALAVIILNKVVFLIPIVFVALLLVRPLRLKEVVIFFIGILSPIILVLSLVFVFGDLSLYFETIYLSFQEKYTNAKYNTFTYLSFLPIITITIIAIVSRFTIRVLRKVSARRYQNALIVVTIAILVVFLSPYSSNETIIFVFAPLSYLLTNILMNSKIRFRNIVMIGLFVGIILSQAVQIVYYFSLY